MLIYECSLANKRKTFELIFDDIPSFLAHSRHSTSFIMSDLNALIIGVLKVNARSEMKEKVDELRRTLPQTARRCCDETGDIVYGS